MTDTVRNRIFRLAATLCAAAVLTTTVHAQGTDGSWRLHTPEGAGDVVNPKSRS